MNYMDNWEEKNLENFQRLREKLIEKSNFDENCVLNRSLTLIANKWTLLILVALIQSSKRTSELQKQIEGISPKMLNETLKKLISYGMVKRKIYPEVPPRVEYSLTKFGVSTATPLAALADWSAIWEKDLSKIYKKKQQDRLAIISQK